MALTCVKNLKTWKRNNKRYDSNTYTNSDGNTLEQLHAEQTKAYDYTNMATKEVQQRISNFNTHNPTSAEIMNLKLATDGAFRAFSCYVETSLKSSRIIARYSGMPNALILDKNKGRYHNSDILKAVYKATSCASEEIQAFENLKAARVKFDHTSLYNDTFKNFEELAGLFVPAERECCHSSKSDVELVQRVIMSGLQEVVSRVA